VTIYLLQYYSPQETLAIAFVAPLVFALALFGPLLVVWLSAMGCLLIAERITGRRF
jgi:hypothetical protein